MGSLKLGKYGALGGLGEGMAAVGEHYLKAGENEKDRQAQSDLRQMLIDARQRENALDRSMHESEADRRHDQAVRTLEADTAWRDETRKDRADQVKRDTEHRGKVLEQGDREITLAEKSQRALEHYREESIRLGFYEADAAIDQDRLMGKDMRFSEGEDEDGNDYNRLEFLDGSAAPYREWLGLDGQSVWIPERDNPVEFYKRMLEQGKAPELDLNDYKEGGGREKAREWALHNIHDMHRKFTDRAWTLSPAARERLEQTFEAKMGHLPWTYVRRKTHQETLKYRPQGYQPRGGAEPQVSPMGGAETAPAPTPAPAPTATPTPTSTGPLRAAKEQQSRTARDPIQRPGPMGPARPPPRVGRTAREGGHQIPPREPTALPKQRRPWQR